ncbi:MAG TPA: sulfite exporter TauE/SafE family protein [Acidimicrobiales bacterium]|nr:sulfite exporter TauE/SafE family protein [Acidimicrobiales bacterium]
MALGSLDYVAVAAAGVAAGAVNAIAGAGSLITFPTLVAVGLTPLSANVTNSIGVVPGNLSGTWGFRRELGGQGRRLGLLATPAALGSILGGVLVLILPPHTFALVAPVLLGVGAIITLVQPAISRVVNQSETRRNAAALIGGVFVVAVYGGYFGSGIGVLFIALLTIFVAETLPRLNAFKTVLQALSNGVAGILFAVFAPVNWWLALTLAVSSAAGGPVGARLSLLIPAKWLRLVIGVLGLVAAVLLALRS